MSYTDQAINDPGPSLEDSDAMEQQSASLNQSHLQSTVAKDALKDPEKCPQESRPYPHKRADGSSVSNRPNEADLTQARTSTCHSDRTLKRSRWLGSIKAYQVPIEKASNPNLKQLDKTWGKDSSKGLIFTLAPPQASTNIEAPNYISWQ